MLLIDACVLSQEHHVCVLCAMADWMQSTPLINIVYLYVPWTEQAHNLKPSMASKLVLLCKTLHPDTLSVTVALHSLTRGGAGHETPLVERLFTLDQLPSSGYDVFVVSPFMFSSKPGRGG